MSVDDSSPGTSSASVYSQRPPKRFTAQDLHGRTRFAQITYTDLERFKRFYTSVFGWDMFVLPSTAGGVDQESAEPSLLIATGPSYETYEAFIPGHMNAMAHYDPTGEAEPGLFMEVHHDRPLKDTIAEIVAHGGRLVGDPPVDDDNWSSGAKVEDPAGNVLHLWKATSSRNWEETPEADWDKD
jgi:predicted enzyme related to lactoylglutathione lyase